MTTDEKQTSNGVKTLSIIIPVFNEQATIKKIITAVEQHIPAGYVGEIIVVDDGSRDKTKNILKEMEQNGNYTILYHGKNQGKGVAMRSGFAAAHGDFIVIQDADLEYDPADIQLLIGPLANNKADIVYGSRFMGGAPHRVLFFWHYLGNKFLTMLSNMCTNLNLTDMETGYKAFSKEALEKIYPLLESNRFGIEPEITAHIAKQHFRIYEVGISYAGRTYAEGKKINWKDGCAALWFIFKYNFLR